MGRTSERAIARSPRNVTGTWHGVTEGQCRQGRMRLAAHSCHGFDPARNAGAQCVECHVPRIVDHARSFKLRSYTQWDPNPAQSAQIGTPDACLLCHMDKDAAWSAAGAARVWPRSRAPK